MLYNQWPTAVNNFIRLFCSVYNHSQASMSQARPHVSIIFHGAESNQRNRQLFSWSNNIKNKTFGTKNSHIYQKYITNNFGLKLNQTPIKQNYWQQNRKSNDQVSGILFSISVQGHNTVMRRLQTGIRSEKRVVRRFRRCANVYLHKPRQ